MTHRGRPLKVLLSAYACAPTRGSEPGVGWSTAQAMASYHEVWVLTRTNNRRPIETSSRSARPRLHFVYYDLPPWVRWLKRGELGTRFYYHAWQVGAYIVARRLQRVIRFDLVHHVTFGQHWVASYMTLLGVPFVWGPVGGGESTPRAFRPSGNLRALWYEWLRAGARWLGEHDPFVCLAARRSAVALAKTEDTADRLRRMGAKDVRVFSEVGLRMAEIRRLGRVAAPPDRPVRFVSVGRLIHWKGFHLGIRAFACAGLVDAEYWVIGDGPERRSLEALARMLGIGDRVRFWGWVPRAEALRRIREAHVFVHPSLHDSGGWVCIEAMTAGLPVICLDLGGPGVQVSSSAGFKIRAQHPEQTIRDLAEAMQKVAHDPGLRATLGAAGRRRSIELFRWERKARMLDMLYALAISGTPSGGISAAYADEVAR